VSQNEPVPGAMTRLIVVVSLFAIVFGRALSVALPGSRTGLGKLLDINRFIGGFSSQLLAVLLVLVIGRLTVGLWQDSRLSLALRLTIVPAAALVVLLLTLACGDALMSPYTPEISLIMGIAGTLVAVNTLGPTLAPPQLRASGFVLVLVTGASVAQMSARLLALQASGAALPRQFVVARALASVASGFDALALLLVLLWLLLLWPRGRIVIVSVAALAVVSSVLSHTGSRPGAGLFSVLVSRGLAQLHREPSSLFPVGLQNIQELLALSLAPLLLWQPRDTSLGLRASLALVLLARSSPDIPLCSGLLVAGALGLLNRSLCLSSVPFDAARIQTNTPLSSQH